MLFLLVLSTLRQHTVWECVADASVRGCERVKLSRCGQGTKYSSPEATTGKTGDLTWWKSIFKPCDGACSARCQSREVSGANAGEYAANKCRYAQQSTLAASSKAT